MVFLTRTERLTIWVLAVTAAAGLAVNGYRLHRERVTVRVVPAEAAQRAEQALQAARRISVNTATVEELTRLPGVGPTLAARIVAYRTAHGPFGTLQALNDVDGVGPTLLTRLSDYVAL